MGANCPPFSYTLIMNFTPEQLETLHYALADAEKFWRHKRRQVKSGECDLYTEQDCTDHMKHYNALYNQIEL